MKEIKFYTTQSGKIPVKEFLDSLSFKHAKKVAWVLELIERLDQVPVQYFKKLKTQMKFGKFEQGSDRIVSEFLVSLMVMSLSF